MTVDYLKIVQLVSTPAVESHQTEVDWARDRFTLSHPRIQTEFCG